MSRQQKSNHGIIVKIAPDQLTATVTVAGNVQRSRITVPAVTECVSAAGVRVDDSVRARIRQFVDRASATTGVFADTIADVRARVSGITWAPGHDPTMMHFTSDEGKAVDHYDRSIFVTVRREDRIASIEPPPERLDVAGNPIDDATPAPLTIDSCTLRVSDGEVASDLDGVLAIEGGEVFVSRRLEVRGNVDFSTGNIVFEGAVHVHEDVRDRFVVSAGEDLLIDGLIEGATIKSGACLRCGRGMAAKERGTIEVAENAQLGFLNNVRGTVGGTLAINGEIMNCSLSVRRDLVAPKGAIIGGDVAVGGRVELGAIGSRRVIPTTLFVGAGGQALDLARVDQLLREMREDLQKQATQIERKQRRIARLTSQEKQELNRETAELSAGKERLAELEARRDKTAEGAQNIRGHVDVHVAKCIHAATTIVVNGVAWCFERDLDGPVRITLDGSDRAVCRHGGGTARLLAEIAAPRGEAA